MHFHRPLQETVPTADAATPAAAAATDAAATESATVAGTSVAVAQSGAVHQLQSRTDSRDHWEELAQALSRSTGQPTQRLLLLSVD